jgi:hypothetical protein
MSQAARLHRGLQMPTKHARRERWARACLFGVLGVALSGVLHARDPGINQPGAAGNVGVGAPGVGVRDPGINQPGAVGNVGVGAPGPGVAPGVGAPGVGAWDPGLNQPGVAGNVGGVARRTVRR